MKTTRIGLVGFGTIGCGVVKALAQRREYLRRKAGVDLVIAKVCDKDITSPRPVNVKKSLLTKSFGDILYDPSIDIVVELVGGIHPAKDIVLEALRQGKSVVTANKALLSNHGDEIFSLACELGLSVGFEASVGGGIPIIKAIKEGFVANKIELISGIVNGTCNFILTRMAEEGLGFDESLKRAQDLGYAERDPSLDINGGDSAHKLAVLAHLAFGISVKPEYIYTEGIAGIRDIDIAYARELGYAVKLLAIAKRVKDEVELRVHPTLVPKDHLLASVNDVFNAIFVRGDLVGENLFYGKGAGALPTSSAVVADIVAIAKNSTCKCPCKNGAGSSKKEVIGVKPMDDVRTRYYLHFFTVDKPGVLAKVSGILGKHDISIASVTQKASKSAKVVPIVMMTHEAKESDMNAALVEINGLKLSKTKAVRIRVEE